jgi:hypothetical protein
MAYAKFDDGFADHPKNRALSDGAFRLHVSGILHSARWLTDGAVPADVLPDLMRRYRPAYLAELIDRGLWREVLPGALYQIHDYLDFNPSSEQERAKREEMREKRRESGRAGGKRSGEVRRAEAKINQNGSTDEANAKQSASTDASDLAKQNEAPSPSPSPKEEQTHTPFASAGGREPKDDSLTTMPIPFGAESEVVTAEGLLEAVRRHEMLSTLHGDRTWALRAVGSLQSAACRAEDATAAVDAFVADKAAKAPPDGPRLDDFVRDGIGPYLKRAKWHGDSARNAARAAAEKVSRNVSPLRGYGNGRPRGPMPQPGPAWIDPAEKNPNPATPEEQETPLA